MRDFTFNYIQLITWRYIPLLFLLAFFISIPGRAGNKAGTEQQFSKALRGNGLMFTPNKGQIIDMDKRLRPDVLFNGDGGGASIYLRKTGISYVLSNAGEIRGQVKEQVEGLEKAGIITRLERKNKEEELMQGQVMKLHRVDMDFIDCNANPEILTSQQVEGYSNYYYPQCPKGITNVYSYNEVSIKNIYKNIDVRYYGGKEQGLKYDIVINPHGDQGQIKLNWQGAENIHIGKDGRLVIKTSLNEFQEAIPKAYQNINGKVLEVKAEYADPAENGPEAYLVTFKLGSYNPDYPLIIDPWATYYGGSESDSGTAIANDNAGNVIVTGTTLSPDFPVNPGAFQTTWAGGGWLGDGFVLKLSNNGSARTFATFIGGSNNEWPEAITADLNGNIITTGWTASTDFPTLNPAGGAYYQNTLLGGVTNCTFLAKFSPLGSLIWSTYYNGGDQNEAYGICTDPANNILITGYTSGNSFPTSVGAYQTSLAGTNNAFVVKFDNSGVRLWATFYGGNVGEIGEGIACDVAGDVFFCGATASANFPVSANAFQSGYGGGGGDGFIAELSGNNGFPVWSTYYGGTGSDYCQGIGIDNLGNVCVAGITNSPNNMASPGAYQPALGAGAGTSNCFVAKFNNAGQQQWGTYLGDNIGPQQYASGLLAIDPANNIYVYGEWEDSPAGTLPISSCAYQPNFTGYEDEFIAKYNPAGTQTCITYMGGTGESDLDLGGGISVFGNSIFITGTTSAGYPVTPGAFQTFFDGGSGGNASSQGDAFIAQVCTNICEARNLGLSYSPNNTNPCVNTAVTFTPTVNTSCDTSGGGYKFEWNFSGGSPATSNAIVPSVTYASSGSYNVQVILTTLCQTDTLNQSITVKSCGGSITAQATGASVCPGGCANLISSGSNGTSPYTYAWSTGELGSTLQQCPNSTTSYTVTVTDNTGLTATSITSITVYPEVSVSLSPTDISCNGAGNGGSNGSISGEVSGGTEPFNYIWSNGVSGTTGASGFSLEVTGLAVGTYTVTVTDLNGCISTSSTMITEPTQLIASSSSSVPSCSGQGSVSATASGGTPALGGSGAGYNFFWSSGSDGPTASNLMNGTYTVTVTDANGCIATTSASLTKPPPITILTSTTTASCNQSDGSAKAIAKGGTGTLSYLWSNQPSGQGFQVPDSIDPGLSAGSYTVTVMDANSCTSTTVAAIGNTGGPKIMSLTATPLLCYGNTNAALSVTATGTGTLSYSWSNGTVWSNGVGGQTIPGIGAGSYAVSVKDQNGCIADSSISITEPPILSIDPTEVSAVCGKANGTATINVTGGTPVYKYTWSANEGSSVLGGSGPIAQGLSRGSYSVTISDANSCTETAIITINGSSPPVITSMLITEPSCNGGSNGSITVNASGGIGNLSYLWSNGVTGETTLQGLAAGQEEVFITDSLGCKTDSTVDVTQPPAINNPTVNQINSTCGNSNGSAGVFVSGGSPGYSYAWASSQGPVGPIGATAITLSAGGYTVTITDSHSCTKTAVIAITNTNGPGIGSIIPTQPRCGSQIGSAVLTAFGGSGLYTYNWSNGSSAITSSNQSIENSLIPGIYTVTVSDASGCTATSTTSIQGSNGPSIRVTDTTNTCIGKNSGSITAEASGGGGTFSYLWSPNTGTLSGTAGGSTSVLSALAAGSYTVTVTDINGCTATTSAMIRSLPNPVISITRDTAIFKGQNIQLRAGGGTSYLWTPSGSLSSAVIANPIAGPSQTTIYTVLVTNSNDCPAEDSVKITVNEPPNCDSATVFLPTAFSPNGDGVNDVLYLRIPINCVQTLQLNIYDRWGELIFSCNTFNQGWDGTYRGKPMDMGVFAYYLKGTLTNGQTIVKKGNVSLLR